MLPKHSSTYLRGRWPDLQLNHASHQTRYIWQVAKSERENHHCSRSSSRNSKSNQANNVSDKPQCYKGYARLAIVSHCGSEAGPISANHARSICRCWRDFDESQRKSRRSRSANGRTCLSLPSYACNHNCNYINGWDQTFDIGAGVSCGADNIKSIGVLRDTSLLGDTLPSSR